MMSQYKKSSRLLPELFKQKKLTVQTRDCWTTGMQPAAAFYAGGPPREWRGCVGGMARNAGEYEYPGGFRVRCQATVRRM